MPNHTQDVDIRKKYKKSDRKRYKKDQERKKNIKAKHLQLKSWLNIKLWAVINIVAVGVTKISEMLGVSRQSIYNWSQRYRDNGKDGLRERSRRPITIYETPKDLIEKILLLRKTTEWGCEKIAFELNTSHMTVYRVLRRYGKIIPGRRRRRKWKFFQRKHANSLWQLDITHLKGDWWAISIIDDHSRFVVGISVIPRVPTVNDAIALLQDSIAKYGAPRQILTDHGAQFYAVRGGVATFTIWCNESKLAHILAGIRRPTTIGKVEKWHQSLKTECVDKISDLSLLPEKCVEFVRSYNYHRPHFSYQRYTIAGREIRKKVIHIPYLWFVTHRKTQYVCI